MALVSGVLYCDPVLAILLLYHKADEPLKRTAGSGPGAVLVVAVGPDLFDGQALELQLVGGDADLVFVCERGAFHKTVAGGDTVRHTVSGVRYGEILCLAIVDNAGLYHPVLQEQEFARVDRFVRRPGIVRHTRSQNRLGQAGEAAAPTTSAQTTVYGSYEFVAVTREELIVGLIIQNLLEILVGVGPLVVVTLCLDLHLEGDGHIFA